MLAEALWDAFAGPLARPVVKHEEHDQKTHGSWARKGLDERLEVARLEGTPLELTREDVQQLQARGDSEQIVDGLTERIMLQVGINNDVEGVNEFGEDLGWFSQDEMRAIAEEYDSLRANGDVCIALDRESMEEVLDSGRFMSQFETQRSGGLYYPSFRAQVELVQQLIHPDVVPERRPIYGYLGFDEESGDVGQYGSVRVVLKPSVKTRTTFTDGDSLGNPVIPQPVSGPPLTVEQAFSVARGAASYASYRRDSGPISLADHLGQSGWATAGLRGYVEAQIRGGVSVKDIAKVLVPRPTPYDDDESWAYGSLVARLDEMGIDWDYREGTDDEDW